MGPGQIEMEALGQELAQVRFTKLYREHGRAVLEYALRRVEAREDAADVVAETFLVVWRRIGEVPEGDGARLWLYGVARLTLANLHRAERRRTRLGRRLAETLRTEISTCWPARKPRHSSFGCSQSDCARRVVELNFSTRARTVSTDQVGSNNSR